VRQAQLPSWRTRAEAFETFLQNKYIGLKRFSFEDGETVIALLDAALKQAAAGGAD
jgi:2-oxoglutarate dehydrogenase E1 component